MSFPVCKGTSTTFSPVDRQKLSFVTFEGDPSRSKKKQVEKAVRVQAAKASAAARKATIARKEAAKLSACTSPDVDGVSTSGKEFVHSRKESKSSCGRGIKRNGRRKQLQPLEAAKPTGTPIRKAHGDTSFASYRFPESAISDVDLSHGLDTLLDGNDRTSSFGIPSSVGPFLDAQASSCGRIEDGLESRMWQPNTFANPQTHLAAHASPSHHPESSLYAANHAMLPDWYHNCNGQTVFDAHLTSCDEVPIPEFQPDDESLASSTTLCSPITPVHNDYFGAPWSQLESQPYIHNKPPNDPTTQVIRSSRLLESYHLMVYPLFNLFIAVTAYNNHDPCAASHLRQLLYQVNSNQIRDEEICRMSLDCAEAQNYIWSGLLSYAYCLCHFDLANTIDDSIAYAASTARQLSYELVTGPKNLPIGTQYDGVLLWSTVSRCMADHSVDPALYNILKTLLKNLSVYSFEELKELMLEFAYHPALLDDRLAALWGVVAADLFNLEDAALLS